jgi:hypothetical protein
MPGDFLLNCKRSGENMEGLFGPVTPMGITILITIITELIKASWKAIEGIAALGISLAVSLLAYVPYHLLVAPVITGMVVYESIYYSLYIWLAANGLYSVYKTARQTVQDARAKPIEPSR